MKIYLIRHGEPDYSFIKKGDSCAWSNVAPLTEKGKKMAEQLKEKPELKTGKVICSNYTRALQTAYIAFGDREITVEPELHEWVPDKTYQTPAHEVILRNMEYKHFHGINKNNDDVWEDIPSMNKRIISVIDKYKNEEKLIIVAHERIINSIMENKKRLDFCEIVELKYEEINRQ